MKTLIYLSLLFVSSFSFSQDSLGVMPLKNGIVTYTGVIKIDSTSADQLFQRAKIWFVETYGSGKAVIQIENQKDGELVGKGCFDEYFKFDFMYSENTLIWHIIKIQVKDNRFRYEISNLTTEFIKSSTAERSRKKATDGPIENWCNVSNLVCDEHYRLIDSQMKVIIDGLIKGMQKPSATEEEW